MFHLSETTKVISLKKRKPCWNEFAEDNRFWKQNWDGYLSLQVAYFLKINILALLRYPENHFLFFYLWEKSYIRYAPGITSP